MIWCDGASTVTSSWVRLPGCSISADACSTNGASPASPGSYFTGLPWLTRRSSGIVRGMVIDAAEVSARIAARAEEWRVAA